MPTAADMAQLGTEIVAGHLARQREIKALRSTVRAEKKRNSRDMRALHRANQTHAARTVRGLKTLHDGMTRDFHGLDEARREWAREHAGATIHRLGEFQEMDRTRQEWAREHAADTGHSLKTFHSTITREFQRLDRARRSWARRHATNTARFVARLQHASDRRRAEVSKSKAAVAHMMADLGRMDAARRKATQELAADVQAQMAGVAGDAQGRPQRVAANPEDIDCRCARLRPVDPLTIRPQERWAHVGPEKSSLAGQPAEDEGNVEIARRRQLKTGGRQHDGADG